MIRRVGLVLVATVGCGRLSFDARSDARPCLDPIGHDEDGDAIDDACDVCPQVVDDQRDGDGDGVGDACDLAATVEQRVMFDPFTAMRSEWVYDNFGTLNGDTYTMPGIGRAAVLRMPGDPGRTILEVGGTITELEAGGFPQVALHIGNLSGSPNYYCELYDGGNDNRLKLTGFVTMYFGIASTPIADPPAPGANVRLLFEHTPPNLRCVGWWNGTRYEVSGLDPGGITPEQATVSINDQTVELTYFSRLATP